MASKYVLFVDEINKEFGKLLEMIKELEKGKADYIQSWKDLNLPWTDDDINRLIYLYESGDSYQAALDDISRQRQKMINWLISNEVDEEIANTMLWPF